MKSQNISNYTMDINFWHARIHITQAPIKQEKEQIFHIESGKKVKIEKTWLCNYFLDTTVYGLELIAEGDRISWVFFLKANTRNEAIVKGNAILKYLKKKFLGLSGKVIAVPIRKSLKSQEVPFYELIFPKDMKNVSFSLIKEFIQCNRDNPFKSRIMKLYILWQEDDSVSSYKFYRLSEKGEFKLKIFLNFNFKDKIPTNSEIQETTVESEMEFLTMDIYNYNKERAEFKLAPPDTWQRILEGEVFWKNTGNRQTGLYYSLIKQELSEDHISSFIHPINTNFTFPEHSGLLKPFILEQEKIIDLPITEKDSNYIWLGKIIRQGVHSESNTYIRIDDLSRSCIIAGVTGTGKTTCASIIVSEIAKKAPDVGILTIAFSKRDQQKYYKPDKLLTYGDDELKIPYFITPKDSKNLQDYAQATAMYLTSSIGLKGTATTNLYNTMMSFNGARSLPKIPTDLFEKTLDFFDIKEHRYHEKFQTNIKSEIRNTVLERIADPILEKTLELTDEIPKWFEELKQGKNIYIDLSVPACDIWKKRLISNALFQMIKALTPDLEAEKLNILIVIDEPDIILAKALSTSPYDDDVIAKERLEIIFKELLEEFRNRGLAFLLIDQEPSSLFKCVSKSPSIKIIFRLDLECGRCFTLDEKELNYLKNQENQQALFFNGATAEEFIFKVREYKVK